MHIITVTSMYTMYIYDRKFSDFGWTTQRNALDSFPRAFVPIIMKCLVVFCTQAWALDDVANPSITAAVLPVTGFPTKYSTKL